MPARTEPSDRAVIVLSNSSREIQTCVGATIKYIKDAVKERLDPFIFIDNLFLAGHWTTLESGQGGITMVVLSGRNVAKTILTKRLQILNPCL